MIVVAIITATTTVKAQQTAGNVALKPNEYFAGTDHDAYIAWYQNVAAPKYTGSAFVYESSQNKRSTPSEQREGVAIHWYVDESYVYVAVAARAQDGWLALGLAEAGGMKGADMVVYETSKPNVLLDAHVLTERVPIMDVCQDWSFVNAVNEDGFLIFEGKRLLDTGDGQDHAIVDDTETFIPAQRIIAAWGNTTSTMTYHGPNNRVRGAIRIYGTTDEVTQFQSVIAGADGYFDLIVNNHTLENVTTKYVEFCFNWDTDIVPQLVHNDTNIYVVAVETLLDRVGGRLCII
jgi:DOMON domain